MGARISFGWFTDAAAEGNADLMVSLRSGAQPRPGARFVFVCMSVRRSRDIPRDVRVDIVAGILAGRREISIYHGFIIGRFLVLF